ncbi:MAG: hypothetical protein K2P26_08685 [Oscillospiraceae bacterium]|nr:hypothetical protein [Oscillospiraceae bacterium]
MEEKRFAPGDEVWVVERDENGEGCYESCYMFLAEVCGFAIVSTFIDDLTTPEETLAYMVKETAALVDTNVCVFPQKDLYETQEGAHAALQSEGVYDE